MLQTTDLTFGRAGGFTLQTEALEVQPGKILGVLGPNGSGKSTLLQLLSGALKPKMGEVTWEGKTRRQWGARRWAQSIASVPQEAGPLPEMEVRHYVSLGLIPAQGVFGSTTQEGFDAVTEAMRICEVEHLTDRRLAELSGGQRQRVRIAKALAQTPQTLILDEPGNHLDLAALELVARLLRTLADKGLAIVVSMHDIDLASLLADEVSVLFHGRTQVVGETTEVLTPELIRRCWGVDMLTIDDGTRQRYLMQY